MTTSHDGTTKAPDPTWPDDDLLNGGISTHRTSTLKNATREHTDHMVLRYLEEIRRYPLLSRAEERALWEQIEHARYRMQRALYMSPIALPILQGLYLEVKQGQRSITEVVNEAEALDNPAQRLQTGQHQLRGLQTQLHRLQRTGRKTESDRLRRITLWRLWLSTWESLQLHPDVHAVMHQALQATPQCPSPGHALRAASAAWSRAYKRLMQCQQTLLHANLRLVVFAAKRYRSEELPLLDLIQEGNLGLMRAVEKFDMRRQLRFNTYAFWWIRKGMTQAIMDQRQTIRIPPYASQSYHKLKAAEERLAQAYSRPPTVEELSVDLDWTVQKVETTQTMLRSQQALGDNESAWAERWVDDRVPPLDDHVAQAQCHIHLAAYLDTLAEREAQIMRLRYGIHTDHVHTLDELSRLFGLSRDRIRRIVNQAFEKLRQPHIAALLADYVVN